MFSENDLWSFEHNNPIFIMRTKLSVPLKLVVKKFDMKNILRFLQKQMRVPWIISSVFYLHQNKVKHLHSAE